MPKKKGQPPADSADGAQDAGARTKSATVHIVDARTGTVLATGRLEATASGFKGAAASTSLSGSAAGTSTASASGLTLSHALAGSSAGTSTATADLSPTTYRFIPTPLPVVPDAFSSSRQVDIPSAFPLQGWVNAHHNAHTGDGGWQEGSDGFPHFVFEQRQGRALISFRPSPSQQARVDDTIRQSLWDQVKQLGDTDGDVVFAALAQWMHPAHRDAEGLTWITSSAILDYRGIKPVMKREGRKRYRAGHRTEDLQKIAACWERLRLTYLDLQQVHILEPRPGKKPKQTKYTLETEFFRIPEQFTQEQLDGGKLAVAWRYRPGRWVDRYLDKPNRQMALLLQRTLQYDPYRDRWEKRLARYFLFHLRINEGDGKAEPLHRYAGKLIKELNLIEFVDRRNPMRTVERFEKAMNHLQDDGQIGSWKYTNEAQAKLDDLPARNWLDAWLAAAAITITVPKAVQEHYAALAERAQLTQQRAQKFLEGRRPD